LGRNGGCFALEVKVTPSNQTLILAGERVGTGGRPASTLQRVTIVAARPDATVLYLRADYTPHTDARPALPARNLPDEQADSVIDANTDTVPLSSGGALVSSSTPTRNALVSIGPGRRDAYGNLPTANRAVEQYASTQRIQIDGSEPVRVDVHA
jgi:hypothetical protein